MIMFELPWLQKSLFCLAIFRKRANNTRIEKTNTVTVVFRVPLLFNINVKFVKKDYVYSWLRLRKNSHF